MMRKKIFIGIALDQHVQGMLTKAVGEWNNLPVQWYAPESYNIKILDLGWVDEDQLEVLVDALHDVLADVGAFDVQMEQIEPVFAKGEEETPRRVRLIGEASDDLRGLVDELRDALDMPHAPTGAFHPMVELGRVQQFNWKKDKVDNPLRKEFPMMIDVVQICVCETLSHDGQTVHEVLDVIELR